MITDVEGLAMIILYRPTPLSLVLFCFAGLAVPPIGVICLVLAALTVAISLVANIVVGRQEARRKATPEERLSRLGRPIAGPSGAPISESQTRFAISFTLPGDSYLRRLNGLTKASRSRDRRSSVTTLGFPPLGSRSPATAAAGPFFRT
jgi:hypothetical protein